MSKQTNKRKPVCRTGRPVWMHIADSRIRHRWDLDCDCQLVEPAVYVDPAFYGDSGTPICEECGQDRKYAGTEVLR